MLMKRILKIYRRKRQDDIAKTERPLGSTCCKNVFISFFSRLQAFYQASRFRLLACKNIFIPFILFISVQRFFFFLFFNTNLIYELSL